MTSSASASPTSSARPSASRACADADESHRSRRAPPQELFGGIMISNVLLLSASLYDTPVFISEVRATREAGHLRVEVSADGGIDPEVERKRNEEGRLILVLGGTHVRADNRAWELEEGVGEIRAHRPRNETELEVPMIGNGCSGPV